MTNNAIPITATAHVPDVITKELALIRNEGGRKLRLSTNFLPIMGFEPGRRHAREVLPGVQGLRLTFDPAGPQKVYQRRYAGRRSNPFEAVVEIANQAVLDAALPGYTERVHITLKAGEILIRPLANRTFSIRRALADAPDPYTAFCAMTSGVDVRCLRDCGFNVCGVLEYRPQEARDTRDLTETGMLTVLANAPGLRYAFNENMSTVDWRRVAETIGAGPRIAVLHVSLQCDDYSSAKARSLKDRALLDLSTSTDLVYDLLRAVEELAPAAIVVEQVPGFAASPEGRLLRTRLARWGYFVAEAVLRADQYGGRTRRERLYQVSSVFPGFAMPQPTGPCDTALWDDIAPFLAQCRDVSATKSVREALASGRARLITPSSPYARTVLKSQARQTKDSLYIAMPDGRYLLPSLDLLQHLNGIPADMDFNSVNAEGRAEQIGQSVDMAVHAAVCRSVHNHLADNLGRHTILSFERAARPATAGASDNRARPAQLDLFGKC